MLLSIKESCLNIRILVRNITKLLWLSILSINFNSEILLWFTHKNIYRQKMFKQMKRHFSREGRRRRTGGGGGGGGADTIHYIFLSWS